LIGGGQHIDGRGSLFFFNDFDLANIKRFYVIEHCDINVVRAWQGHQYEQKWFYAVLGTFHLVVIEPDNWEIPSKQIIPQLFRLSESRPAILHVPGGYATGFRALENNSKLIVFSDKSLDESKIDDLRFDRDYWPDIWDIA
jgi:dTDP-4-dehydrorhamnose 3,5-epimerase